MQAGGGAPTILSAANEIAVEAFLARRIGFLDIAGTVARVLDEMGALPADTLDEVIDLDCRARRAAGRNLRNIRVRRLRGTMFDFLPEFLRTPVAFVIVLGVLVFIHELGHYLAARWCGVHVETFSIGFGRALVSWTDRRRHGVEDRLDPARRLREAARPGAAGGRDRRGAGAAGSPGAPSTRNRWARAPSWSPPGRSPISCSPPCCSPPCSPPSAAPSPLPVVGEVVADSAASRAGLQTGDRIEAIDGTPIRRFEEIQRAVAASPGRTLHLTVASGGASRDLTVIPDSREAGRHDGRRARHPRRRGRIRAALPVGGGAGRAWRRPGTSPCRPWPACGA